MDEIANALFDASHFDYFHKKRDTLTILTGKNLSFNEFSTKIHWNAKLAVFDVFHMFTQSIKFF